jgi:SAM-dependent methyltransferase
MMSLGIHEMRTSFMPNLGANIHYAHAMSSQEEEEQFSWALPKINLITKTLKTLPDLKRVADFGCRNGNEATFFRDQVGIQEMHGFEISEEPLISAKARGIIPHVWISGELPCPVDSDFFDAVVAGDIIEHLIDTDIFLEELKRVVRPGGYLLITTPNLAWWWSRIRLLQGKVPGGLGSVSFQYSRDPAVDKKHLRLSINSEWLNLFRQHNLECVSVTGYNFPGLLRSPLNKLDNWLTKFPTLAHSNLFLLQKPN